MSLVSNCFFMNKCITEGKIMLNVGETVLYAANGVCTVEEITELDFGSGKTKYYILKPISSSQNTFYIAADNQKILSNRRAYVKRCGVSFIWRICDRAQHKKRRSFAVYYQNA